MKAFIFLGFCFAVAQGIALVPVPSNSTEAALNSTVAAVPVVVESLNTTQQLNFTQTNSTQLNATLANATLTNATETVVISTFPLLVIEDDDEAQDLDERNARGLLGALLGGDGDGFGGGLGNGGYGGGLGGGYGNGGYGGGLGGGYGGGIGNGLGLGGLGGGGLPGLGAGLGFLGLGNNRAHSNSNSISNAGLGGTAISTSNSNAIAGGGGGLGGLFRKRRQVVNPLFDPNSSSVKTSYLVHQAVDGTVTNVLGGLTPPGK